MIKICVRTCDMNSTLGSVVPLAMFFFIIRNSGQLDHLEVHNTHPDHGREEKMAFSQDPLDEIFQRKHFLNVLIKPVDLS